MTTPGSPPLAPKHVPPGGGVVLHGPGDVSYIKLAANDTADRLSFTESHVEPGAGPPLHVHTLEDETFYILEGTISFHVGGHRIEATPGTTLFGPRNVPHCFKNNTARRAKMILVVTPPRNFEDFYAAIGARQRQAAPAAAGHRTHRAARARARPDDPWAESAVITPGDPARSRRCTRHGPCDVPLSRRDEVVSPAPARRSPASSPAWPGAASLPRPRCPSSGRAGSRRARSPRLRALPSSRGGCASVPASR